MNAYIPLLVIACLIGVLSACAAWPWLRERQTRERAVVMCFTASFLALALYLAAGSPFLVQPIAAQQSHQSQLLTRIDALRQTLTQAQSSDDAQYALQWVELGASYMELQRFAEAEDALKHGVVASAGDPHVILAYGKAQMLAADDQLTEGAEQALTIASEMMPDNPEPILLMAIGKMQAGDRAGGRAYFKQLLPMLPENAPLRARILKRLQEDGAEPIPK